METIAKAVVSFLELLEAEGRTLKQKTIALFGSFILMLTGGLLMVIAAAVASYALYIYLSAKYGVIAAALIVAAMLAVIGLLLRCKGSASDAKKEPAGTSSAITPAAKEGDSGNGTK
jgi:hypothetical protein